ncbi:membrane hypothetical protein [uncultured Mycobacterium sp.]|uniref:Uncharacterized protein n=1 Tax=uncultured Mycobacterium sp. TaxID=171292 RepID=A0A1Y5PKH3_9MYCO|nr:membrane hypothetical protein [uncultured Mycobacterium sp.]
MSWESEYARDPGWPPASPPPPLAPLLAGFVLGLVVMTATPFVYYWMVMPLLPLVLAGVFALLSIALTPLRHVAEGLFAATLFGVVFVLIAFAGLAASG